MLRITVDLVPFGDETLVRPIGEMVIANCGRNADGTCKYEAWAIDDEVLGLKAIYGVLLEHDRNQSPWVLVQQMLNAMMFEKPQPPKGKNTHAANLKKRLKGVGK